MEDGNDHDRNEGEASNAPANAEVEQPAQRNREQGQNEQTDMQRMLQAMAQMAEQQARYFEAQARVYAGQVANQEEKKGSRHEKFMKLSPPIFSGSVDPSEAEGWIRKMESIFKVMGVQEDQKVNLATFMLRDEASFWWEATKHLLITLGGGDVISWDQFTKAFYQQYFPPTYRRQKEREFILLEQGKMSVAEYDTKFTALSRFASKLVQEEKDKCNRFQDGLELAIGSRISTLEVADYSQLVNKAMIAERDVKESNRRREQFKKRRFDQWPAKGGEIGSSQQGGQGFVMGRGQGRGYQGETSSNVRGQRYSGQRSGQQGGFSERVGSLTCFNCGVEGHTKRDCPKLIPVTCFYCGVEGHTKKDCPRLSGVKCYNCNQLGHVQRNCPLVGGASSVGNVVSNRGAGSGVNSRGSRANPSASYTQGRVFAMTLQDAQATPEVVTGILSISNRKACVLIDPGSTHSFVALSFAIYLGRPLSSLECALCISTPMGAVVVVEHVYKNCVLRLGERELKVDLIPLDIRDFDIILGMDWLSFHHALIDCFRKEVVFHVTGEAETKPFVRSVSRPMYSTNERKIFKYYVR